ncbi:oligosaccharide flippase family protein [Vibrio vulnificus]
MNLRKIIGGSSVYLFSKSIVMIITFLSIPFFTHMMTPTEYGNFSLLITYSGILMPFFCIGVYLSIARASVEFRGEYKEYLQTMIVMCFFVILPFFVLIMFTNYYWVEVSDTISIVLISTYILFMSINSMVNSYYQYEKRIKFAALISGIRGVMVILVSMIFVKYATFDKSFARMSGVVIAEGLFFLYLLINVFNKFQTKNIKRKYVKFAVAYSSPLIIGSLSYILNNQFDRLVIDFYFGSSEVGIYSFAYTIGMLPLTLAIAIRQGVNPYIYDLIEAGDYFTVRKISHLLSFLFFSICALIIIFGNHVVAVVASEEFASSSSILSYIVLGAFIQMMILNESEIQMYFKKTKVNSIIILLGCIINIVLNVIFVPLYGVSAAAISTVITYVVMFIISAQYNKSSISLKVHSYNLYAVLLIVMLALVVI